MERKQPISNQITQIRAAKAQYAKEWRNKNPEKVKAIQDRYWLRRAEKIAAENK